jgi:mono/diheme cytochrome c family protein
MRTLLPLILFAVLSIPAFAADEDVRANYLFACRGCHLADGSGVPPDVPSLRNTLGPLAASAEGRSYLVRVPGVLQSRLSDDKLADVLNWVLTEFNADTLPKNFKPFTTREVAAARKQILADPVGYRRTLRPADSSFE